MGTKLRLAGLVPRRGKKNWMRASSSTKTETALSKDNAKDQEAKSATIKTQLQRAFSDKAAEELPDDLLALIGKLREQDVQNGK